MLLVATAFTTKEVSAFVETPRIEPAHPTTRTPIDMRVVAGGCHAFTDDVDDAELIVVVPGELQLIADGIANLEEGNPFCVDPPFDYRFNMGLFAEGDYIVQLFIRDISDPGTPVAFGAVSFNVVRPASIPGSSTMSLALVGSLILLSGAVMAKRFFFRS